MLIVVIILFILLIALAGGAYYFSQEIIRIKAVPYDETWSETNTGKVSRSVYDSWTKEEFTIPSQYGYQLRAIYIPVQDSRHTVILVHGVTVSLLHSIKYIDLFRSRGFNVVLYDHCRHGKSGGTNTTFGLYEKQDLKHVVDWVMERTGPQTVVGIHGESMGAATALQHAAIDDRAAFYIVDCPYSTLWEQLSYRSKVEYHLPAFPLLYAAGFVCWLRSGMSIQAVSPIRDIAQVTTPVLFIHGKDDDYVPTRMSIDLFEAKPGFKKLYLAPNAAHAESYLKNYEEYTQVVECFLNELQLTPNEIQD